MTLAQLRSGLTSIFPSWPVIFGTSARAYLGVRMEILISKLCILVAIITNFAFKHASSKP